jgi:DNA-binding response OmpR family regulator
MRQALLVIDNKNVQYAIEAIFEQEFYGSIEYYSIGRSEIFSTLDAYTPDIIVILVAEEGRTLTDIIRVIRRQETYEETPIVVMGETEAIEEALLDIGATAVLGATFSQSELTSRIEHLLRIAV